VHKALADRWHADEPDRRTIGQTLTASGMWEELAGGAGEARLCKTEGRVSTQQSLVYRKRTVPIRSLPHSTPPRAEVCQVKRGADQHAPGLELLNGRYLYRGSPAIGTAHYHEAAVRPTNDPHSPFDERWPALLQAREMDVLKRGLERYSEKSFRRTPQKIGRAQMIRHGERLARPQARSDRAGGTTPRRPA